MDNSLSIKISEVSKKYILHHQKPTFIETVLGFKKRGEGWALRDISLEIKKGEKIGIIGNNGSGKSTLLKIITGITTPTQGTVKVNGKIAALINLEAGFHPELTGEENIYLNGLLLGMSKKEISDNFDKIIAFAGLGKVIDTPLFTYSNGMKLRLGFSIAIHSNPDILLIDEVLEIGDQEFQNKVFKTIQNFSKQRKTILYVSHSSSNILNFSRRVIWLDKGVIKRIGKANEVVKSYIRDTAARR